MLMCLVQLFSGSCEFKIGFLIIATIVKRTKLHLDDRYRKDQWVESGFDMIARALNFVSATVSVFLVMD